MCVVVLCLSSSILLIMYGQTLSTTVHEVGRTGASTALSTSIHDSHYNNSSQYVPSTRQSAKRAIEQRGDGLATISEIGDAADGVNLLLQAQQTCVRLSTELNAALLAIHTAEQRAQVAEHELQIILHRDRKISDIAENRDLSIGSLSVLDYPTMAKPSWEK